MYTAICQQFMLFCLFFLLGAVCSVVFDALRAADRLAPGIFVFTVVKDIIFWIVITVFVFAICLKFNNGEIRFFMLLAVFLGVFVYFNTLSRFVLSALCFAVDILKKVTAFLIRIICFPLRLVFKALNVPLIFAVSFTRKGTAKFLHKIKFNFLKLKKFKR